jgi:hypothetical protein
MREIRAELLGWGLAALCAVACGSAPPVNPPLAVRTAEEAPVPAPPPLDVFSAERAWSDLLALTGSEPPDVAALATALDGLGLEVREVDTPGPDLEPEPPPLRHVIATLAGASPDLFVLVAPYDGAGRHAAPPLGGDRGSSGAALLVELARVLSTRPFPYTLRFVFLAGERDASGTESWQGSRAVAEQMDESGELARTRVLVAFDAVCGANLRIARDLASQRVYREEFFKAAKRVGRQDVFPPGAAFVQVEASHLAFLDRGLRASVAIVGAGSADPTAPEPEVAAPPNCVPEGLEAVGLVALEALDTIGRRLEKIDRFARSPLTEIGSPESVPAAARPAEPQVGPGDPLPPGSGEVQSAGEGPG